jgi:peptidoglycan/xylan/chitin deacetylase (PgdA/CDA1 family)
VSAHDIRIYALKISGELADAVRRAIADPGTTKRRANALRQLRVEATFLSTGVWLGVHNARDVQALADAIKEVMAECSTRHKSRRSVELALEAARHARTLFLEVTP